MSWIDEAIVPDMLAIFQVLSLNPEALDAVKGLNETLAFGNSTLSRVQEEAIATVVAVANRCRYGALTHGGFLRRHSGDSDLASQLLSDYTQADLPPEDLQMLDFALKLTLEPDSLTKKDVARLRVAGFQDEDIVSIVLITCLFNFMNRLASSLGVEIPATFQRVVESWLTGPATQQAWLLSPGEKLPRRPSDQTRALAIDQLDTVVERALMAITEQEDATPEDGPGPEPNVEEVPPEDDAPPPPAPPEPSQLEQFVTECCVTTMDQASPAKDLYIVYTRWCDEKREQTMHQRNFGLGLASLGFRRRRRGQGRHWWMGIAVAPTHSP